MDNFVFITFLVIISCWFLPFVVASESYTLKYEGGNCSLFNYDPRPSPEKMPFQFSTQDANLDEAYLAFCRNKNMDMNRTMTKLCCRRTWGSEQQGRRMCLFDPACPPTVFCKIPKSEQASLIFEHCCGDFVPDNMYNNFSCLASSNPSKLAKECDTYLDTNAFEDPDCEEENLPILSATCGSPPFYTNERSTAYCCDKYKGTYYTTVHNPGGGMSTSYCVWAWNHPITPWVVYSKMKKCCESRQISTFFRFLTCNSHIQLDCKYRNFGSPLCSLCERARWQ